MYRGGRGEVLAYPVPIRSVSRDGYVGSCSIDHMVAIGVDSIIAALQQVEAGHFEGRLQLRM